MYKIFLAIDQSSNKRMLPKEGEDYFLGLIEVSLNKTYKLVKAENIVLRINRNENTHTHTISLHSYIPNTCSHFPTNMDAPSRALAHIF